MWIIQARLPYGETFVKKTEFTIERERAYQYVAELFEAYGDVEISIEECDYVAGMPLLPTKRG